jgi:hypothetical protein
VANAEDDLSGRAADPAPDEVPSLQPADDPAEVEEVEKKRPKWWDIPRTVDKSFMRGDFRAPLFGFLLRGRAISEQGVRIGFLADFLDFFRKVFEPLQVVPTGRVPEGNRLPRTSAVPPMVAAIDASHSVAIYFSIDPEELGDAMERVSVPTSLLTFRAVGHLGALLAAEPGDGHLVDELEPFGRRIGRSYGNLAAFLAESGVGADWWSDVNRGGHVEMPITRSDNIADELLRREISEERDVTVGGFMSEAGMDPDRRHVRIQINGRSIRAAYDIPLATQVAQALSRIVQVELRLTTYRYPFAETPHRREWELLNILEVGEEAGALLEATQLRLMD